MVDKKIIETKRLILRELNENDFPALYEILADSNIMKHYPYTFDENRVRNWILKNIERYRVFGFGLWAAVLKRTGKMIGDCGITMQNIDGFIRPEIGYHVSKRFQGRGFAKEAAQSCRDWAFENTPFNIICSYMKKENVPSAATAASNGMKKVHEFIDTEKEITVVYEITRSEWETLKNCGKI